MITIINLINRLSITDRMNHKLLTEVEQSLQKLIGFTNPHSNCFYYLNRPINLYKLYKGSIIDIKKYKAGAYIAIAALTKACINYISHCQKKSVYLISDYYLINSTVIPIPYVPQTAA